MGVCVDLLKKKQLWGMIFLHISRLWPDNLYLLHIPHNKLDLKEIGIPDHLTCHLRNLHAGQEATIRTWHGRADWFRIGKGVHQGCILSPCLFNLMQSTSCKMPGWMKHKLESRLLGEISITQICRWHHPYGRKWRTKEPLDESERGEWKSWFKTHSEN